MYLNSPQFESIFDEQIKPTFHSLYNDNGDKEPASGIDRTLQNQAKRTVNTFN